jgi:signal transduction histidine kinase
MLAQDDFTRPYIRLLFEAFTDEVSSATPAPAIFFESMDAARFEDPLYLDALRAWLQSKYKERPMDMIVTIGEEALGLLVASHGEPWPAAQVLYFESDSVRFDTRVLARAGGLLTQDHFPSEMATIKSFLPDARHVVLMYGASTLESTRWRDYPDKVRSAGLEPLKLVGESMEGLRAAIKELPAQSVIFVLGPTVDASGHVQSTSQICNLIASMHTVPVLVLDVNQLGCGAVGGLMRDWNVVGRLLGAEALKRLATPSTAVEFVPVASYSTLAFDARELEHWGIPESRLPAGAAVRFREPSLWRDNRGLVLSTLAVTLVQSLLIAGLVFERRRRRRAEVESRRNLVAMAHLDRRAAMGELATSLAHELNQPLNAILQNAGVAQMLLASPNEPEALGEVSEIISDIRKDDLRASEVIRRMRGLLQKHELERNPVDLNEITHDTIAIVRPDATSRDVQLDVELADVNGAVGDRVHLQQVLLNLLMNAIDAAAAMPPERRRVRVYTAQGNGEVRVAVADRGTGIRAERVTDIFEPFYTTKTGGSGMGMGLAIARNIIDAHAGRMGAENNDGGGATVWFSVPVATAQIAEARQLAAGSVTNVL